MDRSFENSQSVNPLFSLNPVSCTLRQRTMALSHVSDHIKQMLTHSIPRMANNRRNIDFCSYTFSEQNKAQTSCSHCAELVASHTLHMGKCYTHYIVGQHSSDEKPLLQLCLGHPPTITQRPLGIIQQLVT